jgi:SAM-dependent methyltransferase
MMMLVLENLKDFCLKEIKKKLREYYAAVSFFPGILGLFLNPFYFARKGLASHISAIANNITGLTLDVGCGTKPYQKLFASTTYWGLEIDTPESRKSKHADYFYDGKVFPFEDSKFDSIVANQVFEHVFNPEDFLNESYRILKPEGKILMTVPFVWDEHEQPYDFARYSSFGLKALLEKHGFEIIEQRKSISDIRVIFQLINAYIFKVTCTKNKWLNLVLTILLMAPFNIIGELIGLITPNNPDLYLDNILLAKKSAFTNA